MITRYALPQDASGMAELLNEIIAIGGTTAHLRLTSETNTRGRVRAPPTETLAREFRSARGF